MERKDVTVNLGTARAVAGAGLGGTPPAGDAEAGDGHLGASEEAVSGSGAAKCETCGSTDRVSPYGMDGTPLCWQHMLEANAEEDALVVANQVVSAICAIGRVADADEVSVDDWSMGCAAWEAINGRRLTETEADEALRLIMKSHPEAC